jgi:hypothetical protein
MRGPQNVSLAFALVAVLSLTTGARLAAASVAPVAVGSSRQPVIPGQPGVRPFWNQYSTCYIYAPAFDLPEVADASRYRFTLRTAQGEMQFLAGQPWAPLSPIWDDVPEGLAELS